MTGHEWQEKIKNISDKELIDLQKGLALVISVDLFRQEYHDTGICIIELYAEREIKNRGL